MEELRKQSMWLMVLLIGIIIVLLIWLIREYGVKASQYKKGVWGFNQVQKMLKKYAALRSYKVLGDVTLSDGKHTAHADHILIGFFGVILLQNVQGNGEYFGEDTKEQWTYLPYGGEKQYIDNPYIQSVKAEEVLRRRLAQDGVYNVQIESYVVLSGDKEKTVYNGSKNNKILTMAGLKKLLSHSKYEKDNDIDVPKLAEYLKK